MTSSARDEVTGDQAAQRRRRLRADCGSCLGFCCVVPGFGASSDFAIDKPPRHPCPHLTSGFRCEIHQHLRPRGFPGCVAYDCYGAGQQVAQVTFSGRDWRSQPAAASQMFDVFEVVRSLHELLWYLTEALALALDDDVRTDLESAYQQIEDATAEAPETLLETNVTAIRARVGGLLDRLSESVRGSHRPARPDRRGADLAGADLRTTDLRSVSLRGACLIGADLRDCDLSATDLLGADLRGALLAGADLQRSIFLTQSQVEAAHGGPDTMLPPAVSRPAHWLVPAAIRAAE